MSSFQKMTKLAINLALISVFTFIVYKTLYGILFFSSRNLGHKSTISIILDTESHKSPIPISTEVCDEGDKYRIRAPRYFNKSNVGKCLHRWYHAIYYDDISNTLCAAINVLYDINATFVIVQGTLLSVLRNQPVLPWDADADIYLLLNNTNTNTDDDWDEYNDYFQYFDFFRNDAMDKLFEKVKIATDRYKSNAKNGKQKYKVIYDVNDAPNIFRFMKKEATNWGCTGYTDIYVIVIDEQNHMFIGGDAGRVAHEPVGLDYIFPIKQYTSDWFPHWRQNTKDWDGETLNRNTIPIPAKPHKFSELAYPQHMVPDSKEAHLLCTLI